MDACCSNNPPSAVRGTETRVRPCRFGSPDTSNNPPSAVRGTETMKTPSMPLSFVRNNPPSAVRGTETGCVHEYICPVLYGNNPPSAVRGTETDLMMDMAIPNMISGNNPPSAVRGTETLNNKLPHLLLQQSLVTIPHQPFAALKQVWSGWSWGGLLSGNNPPSAVRGTETH